MNRLSFSVDQARMVELRRQVHMYPELGNELPKTTALVKSELEAIGVPYTEKYGKGSVVATVNEDKPGFTIAIRADMDALEIVEAGDAPYRSRCEGRMHACGHDAHTAMLLGAARTLWEIRERINCRVKLFFQPSEERSPSGARMMCENGVMEGVDMIIMCHVNCGDPCGSPSVCAGVTNATSRSGKITLHGHSVHVAAPHAGIDAIAMAVKVYTGLQFILSREVDPFDTCVLAVPTIRGGSTTGVNADTCEMTLSLRALKDETAERLMPRVDRLVKAVCEESGGVGEVKWAESFLPCAYNDPRVAQMFAKTAEKVVGKAAMRPLLPSPGGEDFAFYERYAPGVLFGLGLRNDEKGFNHPAHTKEWDIDESGLEVGACLFVQFVLDHMDDARTILARKADD